MSLVPFLFDLDPWELRGGRFWRNWDDFGLGITPAEIESLLDFPRLSLNDVDYPAKDLKPTVLGKDGFQACIDVKQFKPNEVTVKTVDNSVIVEGKHEERHDDKGYISRHFVRRYDLPKGFDPAKIVSSLSSDGVLTVKAPPPQAALEGKERVVQIQQTGPAHLNIKENPSSGDVKKK